MAESSKTRPNRFAIVLLSLLLTIAACGDSAEPEVPRGFTAALGTGADQTLSDLITAQMNSLLDDEVTRCMKAEGFEYVPEPQVGGMSGRVGDQGELSDEDYASQFGFGIWESFNGPGLSLPDPTTFKSANGDHLETLGEAEAAAWRDQQRLCTRQGWESQDRASEVLNPFFEAQSQIFESVAADNRVIAAKAEWSNCMGAQGFPFADPDEMFHAMLTEFRELPEGAGSNQVVAIGDESPASAEGLAFAGREIAIAETSFECSTDLRAIEYAVRLDLEDQRLASDPSIIQALADLEDLRGN